MIRLTHVFVERDGADDMEAYARDTYLPLARELPGALRTEVGIRIGSPFGDLRVRVLIEQTFESEDMMESAMASPAGRRLSRELMSNPRSAPELLVFAVESTSPATIT